MDDWLVSVVEDGKVKELYLSDDLCDIRTIKALHKGNDVERMRIVSTWEIERPPKYEYGSNDGWHIRRVMCADTGEVFASVSDCAEHFGVSRWNVYKAIRRGITAGGHRFVYLENENNNGRKI